MLFRSFIPTWYKELGYSAAVYSGLATTILLESALGTIGSGSIAENNNIKFTGESHDHRQPACAEPWH